jgi:hypothetical protein
MSVVHDKDGLYETSIGSNSHMPQNQIVMQSPAGSATQPFVGWSAAYQTVSTEFVVQTGTPYANRSAEQKEILTAMERQQTHFVPSFYVYRVTVPSGREGNYACAYHTVRTNPGVWTTTGAFLKRISGNMPTHAWTTGYDTSAGGWQLCGMHYGAGGTGYTHNHPYGAAGNSACVFLAAMPMTLWGRIDMSRGLNWWAMPNSVGNFNTG